MLQRFSMNRFDNSLQGRVNSAFIALARGSWLLRQRRFRDLIQESLAVLAGHVFFACQAPLLDDQHAIDQTKR
jgi:hypothetical protein